jgi:hypothetical protein
VVKTKRPGPAGGVQVKAGVSRSSDDEPKKH